MCCISLSLPNLVHILGFGDLTMAAVPATLQDTPLHDFMSEPSCTKIHSCL